MHTIVTPMVTPMVIWLLWLLWLMIAHTIPQCTGWEYPSTRQFLFWCCASHPCFLCGSVCKFGWVFERKTQDCGGMFECQSHQDKTMTYTHEDMIVAHIPPFSISLFSLNRFLSSLQNIIIVRPWPILMFVGPSPGWRGFRAPEKDIAILISCLSFENVAIKQFHHVGSTSIPFKFILWLHPIFSCLNPCFWYFTSYVCSLNLLFVLVVLFCLMG